MRIRGAIVAAVLAGVQPAPADAQSRVAGETMPLYEEELGSHAWPISTRSPEAQKYFDQGLRLMYAYAPADARRSFAEARVRDPECAMCWWGEAWAMGPYLNGGMNDAD